MSLATVAAVVTIGSGIKSILSGGGGGGGQTPQQAQQAVDPFASYRPEFAAQYAAAMKPGAKADPTTMPGYSAFQSGVLNPSLEATKRVAAQSGMSYSGNEVQALTRTGEQGYYGFMTDYMNRLATGSGAANNPAQGGAAGTAQSNLGDTATMQGLGGILQGAKQLQGIGGLFGSNTPTDMTGFKGNAPWEGSYSGTSGYGTLGSGTYDFLSL